MVLDIVFSRAEKSCYGQLNGNCEPTWKRELGMTGSDACLRRRTSCASHYPRDAPAALLPPPLGHSSHKGSYASDMPLVQAFLRSFFRMVIKI
jgi:hypothetical protein